MLYLSASIVGDRPGLKWWMLEYKMTSFISNFCFCLPKIIQMTPDGVFMLKWYVTNVVQNLSLMSTGKKLAIEV